MQVKATVYIEVDEAAASFQDYADEIWVALELETEQVEIAVLQVYIEDMSGKELAKKE